MLSQSTSLIRICVLAFWGLLIGALIALTIAANDGNLIYALDDPYIHLALAETLLEGGYGINSNEYAAPSSSMAYPYILAAMLKLGAADLGPMIVNLAATFCSVWLLISFLTRRVFVAHDLPALFLIGVSVAFTFIIGGYHLAFTGMEHTLHVFAIIAGFIGLVNTVEEGRASPLLLLSIVLMPLMRFEGVAYAGALIVALIVLRHYVAGIGVTLVLGAIFAAYIQFMLAHDLPLLPSSVMTKSAIASSAIDQGGGFVAIIARNLYLGFISRQGLLLFIALLGLFAAIPLPLSQIIRQPFKSLRENADLLIIVTAGAGLSAHAIAGAYGWFARYEVYAVTLAALGLIYIYREQLTAVARRATWLGQAALVGIVFVCAGQYVTEPVRVTEATQSIYQQQAQMHRFLRDYHDVPVAINDLGLVSYRNDNYVLDLWGLGSEPVRKARADGSFNAALVEQWAREKNVEFAMIYAPHFEGAIPDYWVKVAVMSRTAMVNDVGQEVSFYTLVETPGIAQKLEQFAIDLPSGASIEILPAAYAQGS